MKQASLLLLAGAVGVLLGLGHQAQAQVFTVDIPPVDPVVINGDSSSLHNTLGDAAGNTLYVVEYHRTVDLGGGVTDRVVAGMQWVLVSRKGQIVATRDFGSGSGFPEREVFFSVRRILAQVDSGNGVFVEGFRPVAGRLESEGVLVALDGVTGRVTRQATQKPPERFFDVEISTDGMLTSIQRFDVRKLRPVED